MGYFLQCVSTKRYSWLGEEEEKKPKTWMCSDYVTLGPLLRRYYRTTCIPSVDILTQTLPRKGEKGSSRGSCWASQLPDPSINAAVHRRHLTSLFSSLPGWNMTESDDRVFFCFFARDGVIFTASLTRPQQNKPLSLHQLKRAQKRHIIFSFPKTRPLPKKISPGDMENETFIYRDDF